MSVFMNDNLIYHLENTTSKIHETLPLDGISPSLQNNVKRDISTRETNINTKIQEQQVERPISKPNQFLYQPTMIIRPPPPQNGTETPNTVQKPMQNSLSSSQKTTLQNNITTSQLQQLQNSFQTQPQKIQNTVNIETLQNLQNAQSVLEKPNMPPYAETFVQNEDNEENTTDQESEKDEITTTTTETTVDTTDEAFENETKSKRRRKKSNENRIKVVVRVRPPIPEDTLNVSTFESCVSFSEDGKRVILKRQTYDEREFTFDHVLPPEACQTEMYQCVGHDVVEDVLRGYNGTILAYGQTGTGKTYTIFGPNINWDIGVNGRKKPSKPIQADSNGEWKSDELDGVIPRSIHQIFDHIKKNKNSTEFRVAVSFLQIYMENLMDLLDTSKTNLNIREDPRLGIFVENLTQVVVQEPVDILELIKEGAQNRVFSCTNMNKVSSRSHVILFVTLEQKLYEEDKKRDGRAGVRRGVLTIVDLAGSERVSKSGSEGQRLEEAKKINRSLSALGNCVAALIDGHSQHIPFRDSKLTRLLTDSLGGNSKTSLVATIGPAVWNYDESHSTLLFAQRAMAIKTHAVINEVVDFKTLSGNLQRKISLIENEKFRLMARNVDLEREVSILRKEITEIRQNSENLQLRDASLIGNQTWEEREKELIAKFTSIIHHLQMEIAKQNMMYMNLLKSGDSDAILEQLATGFLAIPALREKIIKKLKESEQNEMHQAQTQTVDPQPNQEAQVQQN